MQRLLIGAAALALANGAAAHAQMVSAPGGWPWFEVSPDGMEIEEATATRETPQIIIKADQPTGDAKELQPPGNLGTISRLTLSPDDQTLYFETTPNGYDGTVRSTSRPGSSLPSTKSATSLAWFLREITRDI